MYLIWYADLKVRQTERLRSDSLFYGLVFDHCANVFRFRDGKFERMIVVQKERPGSSVLHFAEEWREVPREEEQE